MVLEKMVVQLVIGYHWPNGKNLCLVMENVKIVINLTTNGL